jgi:hypothetical protein
VEGSYFAGLLKQWLHRKSAVESLELKAFFEAFGTVAVQILQLRAHPRV